MNYQIAKEADVWGARQPARLLNALDEHGIERRAATTAEPLLTVKDVAKLLNLAVRTVWRRRSAGEIPPPVEIGGSVRWRPDDLKSWIAAGCPPLAARENDPRRK